MPVIRVSLFFKKENIPAKVNFAGNVINALNADAEKTEPLFPDLPVSVKDLESSNSNLSIAGNDLINGGRNAKEAAKNAVTEWDAAFTETANYITTASGNDPLIISLSGFLPTKSTREKKAIPAVSETFKATINGTKGAIIAGSKKGVARAKAHIVTALPPGATISYLEKTVIITIGNSSVYISAFTGKGTELYTLESGLPYLISMFSINSAGHGPATPGQEVRPQ